MSSRLASAKPESARSKLIDAAHDVIRRQGYAVDNGEHQIWVRCVAAPIRSANGRVFAGISVTGPADRISDERIPMLSEQVIQTADSISRHLGYREGS